ncbi:hypothetical protein SAMN05216410_3590 [Sanguibacter gelidistatuariae]|uniref:Uncharacterized protein n=1 Tax=Sanguibacter gelidistatuariae TaxID=1814289 RepID=A0A1G6W9Q1_9MICO|nr:hypothetical protein [Sanguibacter gelidistatuariae]SDD62534.1 hypothetical protein SAMN05216410_3590 [Sanguibacter gelidistatuariae]
MKMPFSRKVRAAYIPEGVTETWSAEENSVVVHVPIDASSPDTSVTADRLSELVIATVGAVQAGLFGHSIPDGASGAGVRIQVDTGTDPLPPLAEHGVEILREHLGQSIPLSVVTAKPAPVAKAPKGKRKKAGQAAGTPATAGVSLAKDEATSSDDSDDELDEEATVVAPPAVVEPPARPGLEPAAYTWDSENERLRAEIVYLGAADSDAQTQVDVRTLVEITIAALASPATRAQIPAEAPASHPVWLTVVVNEDAVGPLTEKMFENGEDQFEGTRVDFVVVTEPREVVVGMLAGR